MCAVYGTGQDRYATEHIHVYASNYIGMKYQKKHHYNSSS